MPPTPEVTPDENKRLSHVEKIMFEMEKKINMIYNAVVGNEEFGQEGIIARLKRLESENEKNKALKNKLVGAFIAGGAFWTIIWEVIRNSFLK